MDHLDEVQKWKVEMLASNGGFSDRFIAGEVFGILPTKVSPRQLSQVRYHRMKQRLLLTDWREGRTTLAKQHARSVSKAPTTHKSKRKKGKAA